MKQEINQLLQKEADAILNIPKTNNFEAVIDLIYKSVHENNG